MQRQRGELIPVGKIIGSLSGPGDPRSLAPGVAPLHAGRSGVRRGPTGRPIGSSGAAGDGAHGIPLPHAAKGDHRGDGSGVRRNLTHVISYTYMRYYGGLGPAPGFLAAAGRPGQRQAAQVRAVARRLCLPCPGRGWRPGSTSCSSACRRLRWPRGCAHRAARARAVARKLAVYVRARLKRSRGWSGPDRGLFTHYLTLAPQLLTALSQSYRSLV